MEKETLEYALADLQRKVDNILLSVDELKKGLPNIYVSKEIYRSEMLTVDRRIRELESTNDRAFWALLAGGASLIFTMGKAVLGL